MIGQRPALVAKDPSMTTKQAVVLVGGKGTRLGELTAEMPKPLLVIDDRNVFLDDILFNVARFGFTNILLLAGHLHEMVVGRYEGKSILGANLKVVVEPSPAGTAGALMNAAPHLDPTFLFMNGDTLFDINLRRLEQHLEEGPDALAVLALRRVLDRSRFGSVEVSEDRITAFREKNAAGLGHEGLVNAGIALMRREILSFIDRLPCSIESDVYPQLVTRRQIRGAEFEGYFIDIGLPETLAQARREFPGRRRRPAIFFDRDGVLNHDSGYTHRVEDLKWIDGAIEIIGRANDEGALVFVISNQAGVGHGFYTSADVDIFHAAMSADLARAGAHIDAFYTCPYHPGSKINSYRHPDHPDRKPNPGMILRALAEWPVDTHRSIVIGDQEIDIEAARRAGLRGILFEGTDLRHAGGAALDMIAGRG